MTPLPEQKLRVLNATEARNHTTDNSIPKAVDKLQDMLSSESTPAGQSTDQLSHYDLPDILYRLAKHSKVNDAICELAFLVHPRSLILILIQALLSLPQFSTRVTGSPESDYIHKAML